MDLHPNLSVIVAASENGVIGRNGELPWRLSGDLRLFKKITMGHHLVMGRKTYESIGRLLPGRTTVILTGNRDYQIDGARMAHSLEEVSRIIANDTQPFVVGGAELYRQILPVAKRLFLTRVHAEIFGDAFFEFDPTKWQLVSEEFFPANTSNEFAFTWQEFERNYQQR